MALKSFILVALQLSPSFAATIQPRQITSAIIGPLLEALKGKNATVDAIAEIVPAAKLVKIRNLEPKITPTAKRMVVQYGPYELVGREV